MLATAAIFLIDTLLTFLRRSAPALFHAVGARGAAQSDFRFHQRTDQLARAPRAPRDSGLMGLDIATLILAWLVQFLELFLKLEIGGYQFGPAAGNARRMALLAFVSLVRMSLYILMAVLIVQAIDFLLNPSAR